MIAEIIPAINNKNVDRAFDYLIPPELDGKIKPGMRVTVPFGASGKLQDGYVTAVKRDSIIDREKLKSIFETKDEYPVFNETMMNIASYMRGKYYSTLSSCLQCILPSGISLSALKLKFAYINYDNDNITGLLDEIKNGGGKQANIIKLLEETGGMAISELRSRLGISQSPIDTLRKKGVLVYEPVEVERRPFRHEDYAEFTPHRLYPEQEAVFNLLSQKLDDGYSGNKTVLLHGVTGSGKTEVYMRLIDLVIKSGKQAIMLVPEIALTPQTVKSFAGRFGEKVSVTHSRLSDGERFDQWKKARDGKTSIMIGPRSAIFTPFDKLGIIIIDEEHEATYKSETTPKYNAKELAAELSRLTGCLVVLGSATPSVETYNSAIEGKIELAELRQRVNNKPPEIIITDMRRELALGNKTVFGTELRKAIAENLRRKELTILFLNRRGHSTFVSCRACGHVLSCGQCSINYTYHLASDRLMCHYCSEETAVPVNCPVCGSRYIKYFGAGTQKIEEEIRLSFPGARVLRMDMDTTSRKNSHENIYRSFLNGEADILIGTQMIAKGLDFPKVTLVGIIAADINIHMGDFRSAERAYQLITQVSGRAGRAELPGRVFIQTYNPEHYSIKFSQSGNYKAFYEHEISIRRQMAYPPFSHLFVVLMTGENEKKVVGCLIRLYNIMFHRERNTDFELFPPTPASVSKIKKIYRHKLIVKAFDEKQLESFAFNCVDELRKLEDTEGVNINCTLDPLNIP